MRKWGVLTPLYEDLDMIKLEIVGNRVQLANSITQLHELEHGALTGNGNSTDDDEWEFMDASWTPPQLSRGLYGGLYGRNQNSCIAHARRARARGFDILPSYMYVLQEGTLRLL